MAAFAVIALGTRAVGAAQFAPVSVLWSLWALSAAAVSFPLQQWAIRSAEIGGEGSLRRGLARIVPAVLVLGLVAGVVSIALGDRLYTTSPTAFAVMTGLLPLGGAVVGIQRGLLAHRGQFAAVAVSFAGENVIRVLVCVVVFIVSPTDETAVMALGWGIVAGFGMVAVFVRSSTVRGGASDAPPASLRLLSGFAGANVAAQVALTSGPVVLSLMAAADAVVTQVFAVLAIVRIPYTGLTGAAAAVSGPLTRMARDQPGRLHRLERRATFVVLAAAAATATLAPVVLDPITSQLFATSLTIPGVAQVLFAAGGVIAIGGLLEMLLLLAVGLPRRLFGAWTAALAVGAAALALPIQPATRVAAAFFASMLAASALMLLRRTS